MAFIPVHCPECGNDKNVLRKRRTGIRYAQCFDDKGIAIGESRYYQLHCHACQTLFYLEERHFYAPEAQPEQHVASKDEYQKASLHKPGLARIGTTASQYTLMIAAGADNPYALRRLAYNR